MEANEPGGHGLISHPRGARGLRWSQGSVLFYTPMGNVQDPEVQSKGVAVDMETKYMG